MVRVNVLCLAGGLLGILCLAVPLMTVTMTNWVLAYPPAIEYGSQQSQEYMTSAVFLGNHVRLTMESLDLVLAPVLFLLGTLIAFVTPLGGALMATGMVDYSLVVGTGTFQRAFEGPETSFASVHWEAAFYIGILAAVVVLVSIIMPLGPGYSGVNNPWPFKGLPVKERLLVWTRGKKA